MLTATLPGRPHRPRSTLAVVPASLQERTLLARVFPLPSAPKKSPSGLAIALAIALALVAGFVVFGLVGLIDIAAERAEKAQAELADLERLGEPTEDAAVEQLAVELEGDDLQDYFARTFEADPTTAGLPRFSIDCLVEELGVETIREQLAGAFPGEAVADAELEQLGAQAGDTCSASFTPEQLDELAES
jgi:hypothetical protein